MTELTRCPSCNSELPPDAPGGVCPKCLVQAGFQSESPREPAATATSPSGTSFVPPSPAELARFFPQLEILDLLGRGGMGAVYKARQPSLDRVVALKILPPETGRDPAFADRFSREARALARLNHPNIVAIYESGETQGLYYFVMEYVDGVNLRQTMHDGGVSPEQALAIIPQVCEALQYAHDEGVVHRDVKPENILLDKKGRVKIADFGLSKLLGHDSPEPVLTGTHQVMGTLRYMAPEQMEGTRTVDHRADIYSLGVVFYELLTGEVPMGRFEPPSHKVQIDVRLDEIVLRSLAREPTKRYQHASEVKTDVEAIRHSPQPTSSTKAIATQTRRTHRQSIPALWVAGILLLLAIPVLGVVALIGSKAVVGPWPHWIVLTGGIIMLLLLMLVAIVLIALGVRGRVVVDSVQPSAAMPEPSNPSRNSVGCVAALVVGVVLLAAALPLCCVVGIAAWRFLAVNTKTESTRPNEAILGPLDEMSSSATGKSEEKAAFASPMHAPDSGVPQDSRVARARPSAERVARRAQVLALVMYRASLEQFPGEAKYEALHAKLPSWIEKLGLASECEKSELDLLQLPLGKADEGLATNASWRNEGLGVLAWALRQFELPPYDKGVNPAKVGDSIGFNEDLLAAGDTSIAEKFVRNAELRTAAEIDRYAVHATLINWRLRTYRLSKDLTGVDRKGMDFVGYLREHPSFKESWLNGLRLLEKDLAVGAVAIGEAKPADVETCEGTAVERQLAAYWLRGDNPIYSQVDPATILFDLGESVNATKSNEE